MTHKRVVAVVISIWVISIFRSSMALCASDRNLNLISVTTGVVGLCVTTVVYIRVYLTVRRHKNQIHVLQVLQDAHTSEMANFASLIKSAISVFYVYLAYLVCYFPFLISAAMFEAYGPNITWKRYALSSFTLVFLNSSLNPVIYCWKMRHIRHAVMNILRNMAWHRNRTSH